MLFISSKTVLNHSLSHDFIHLIEYFNDILIVGLSPDQTNNISFLRQDTLSLWRIFTVMNALWLIMLWLIMMDRLCAGIGITEVLSIFYCNERKCWSSPEGKVRWTLMSSEKCGEIKDQDSVYIFRKPQNYGTSKSMLNLKAWR